jgi:transcriptional regulator with XRE-family HTH domain
MNNIKQKMLSEMANVSQSMLSQILSGKRRSGWKTAKRLASVTGSTPEQWLEAPPDILRRIIQNMRVQRDEFYQLERK